MAALTVRLLTVFSLVFIWWPAVGQEAAPPPVSILGFSPTHAATEGELETLFQSLPSAHKAREWHRIFTANPHPAASAQNNKLAVFLAREWRNQGWEDVTLRRYDVLHSSPRSVTLEMTAPVHFKECTRAVR